MGLVAFVCFDRCCRRARGVIVASGALWCSFVACHGVHRLPRSIPCSVFVVCAFVVRALAGVGVVGVGGVCDKLFRAHGGCLGIKSR